MSNIPVENSAFLPNVCSDDLANNLPLEVITHILNFLPYSDMSRARLVCSRWYRATLFPELINKERLILEERHEVRLIKRCERDFYHLTLKGIQRGVWNDTTFWVKFGPKLKSLSLCKAVLRGQHWFDQCLNQCPKLESLSFIDSEVGLHEVSPPQNDPGKSRHPEYAEVKSPMLKNLQVLKIINYSQLNRHIFRKIIANAPSLAQLFLVDFYSSRDSMCPVSHRIGTGVPVLTLRHVYDCFVDNHQPIVQLHIRIEKGRCPVCCEWSTLKGLICLPNIQLTTLLCDVPILEGLPKSHQPFLRELKIRGGEVRNGTLNSLHRSFAPNLEKLDLVNCTVGTAIRNLYFLNKLTKLSLSALFPGVTEGDLLAGMCSVVNTTMKEVRFSFCFRGSSNFFIKFARTHPSLTHLDLFSCDGFDDWALQAVFQYQPSLRVLKLSGCTNVSDTGLKGNILNGNPMGYSLACLKDLQSLDLSLSRQIHGTIFRKGLKLPKLEFLVLDFTQVSLKTLKCLVENHPRIKRLGVADLPVTDEFFNFVVEKLPGLQKICVTEIEDETAKNSIDSLRGRGIKVQYK